jgi:predicted Zn-dependent peptidase
MSKEIKVAILTILAFFTVAHFSVSQQTQRRQRPSKPVRQTAPYLRQAALYEETPNAARLVMKNGMTVVVNEYRAHPVVAIQLHVRGGYLDGSVKNFAIPCLLENILYEKTALSQTGVFRRDVALMGGILGSRTDYYGTSYEIVVPASAWRRAVRVQAKALLNFPEEPVY